MQGRNIGINSNHVLYHMKYQTKTKGFNFNKQTNREEGNISSTIPGDLGRKDPAGSLLTIVLFPFSTSHCLMSNSEQPG